MTQEQPALVSTPNWARPDDDQRRERLAAMKTRATALLGAAAVVFVVAWLFEFPHPWLGLHETHAWLGYVRATAEASLVGGLADWFAVTALFRHPLGLPIPHTAIVATRKDRIGRVLGNFVQNHFLSRDVIAANLRAVHPAARAAAWVASPEHSRTIAQQMAGGLARTVSALPDAELRELVREVVNDRIRATRLAPALGKTLGVILAGERRQELVGTAVRLAAEAVHDNEGLIRQQVKNETPWWVPSAFDERIYQRIVAAIERLLRGIGTNPVHPLRAAFDRAIQDFVDRLQNSPELIAKAETLKDEFLKDPSVLKLSDQLWDATRNAVVAYGSRGQRGEGERGEGESNEGEIGGLAQGIASFGAAVLANEQLLAELDEMAVDLVAGAVERYRQEIGDLIATTVAGWDPAATSERFELAVGRDLQFVRINGTLVGGLVGLGIYTIAKLLS